MSELLPEPLLCRLPWPLGHNWHIWCVSMDGHQSYRERRCGRCLDAGIVTIERQARSYFGTRATGPWVRQPRRAKRGTA